MLIDREWVTNISLFIPKIQFHIAVKSYISIHIYVHKSKKYIIKQHLRTNI